MRVLLVHNPGAGVEDHDREMLIRSFERADHTVHYCSTKEDGWTRGFDRELDVAIAAGGDGTVAKTASELVKRDAHPDTALAILPLGTANNISRALGSHGSADEMARALDEGERKRLAVGVARSSHEQRYFVEAAGVGGFASWLRATRDAKEELGREPVGGFDAVAGAAHVIHALSHENARALRVRADGVDLSGDYVMLEAANIPSFGPRLALAPNADPGDEWLDLVLVRASDREALIERLEQSVRGEAFVMPMPSRRAKKIELVWPADGGHLDDKLWPEDASPRETTLSIARVLPVIVAAPA